MEKWIENGRIEPGDLGRIYELLARPLPQEAVQKTNGRQTGTGYDTTGYRPQFFTNRMNEVVGLGGWRIVEIREDRTEEKVTFGKGEGWEVIMTVRAEIGNRGGPHGGSEFIVLAERTSFGGQRSRTLADARKGALSAGSCKALSGFGVGKLAYEGLLDEALQSPEDRGQRTEDLGQTKIGAAEKAKLEEAQAKFEELGAPRVFIDILKTFGVEKTEDISVQKFPIILTKLREEYKDLEAIAR